MQSKIIVKNEIKKLVSDILPLINKNKIILLDGEIGSGKTTLVKEIANQIGEREVVNSPTFNIMKVYDKLVHIDAYKIWGSLEEFEDYFEDKIVIIEWSKNLHLDYKKYLTIKIDFIDDNTRKYTIQEYDENFYR